ncbi:MAG: sulfite exporter TauE/SafE family protein [Bryobacteraceae bacterium]
MKEVVVGLAVAAVTSATGVGGSLITLPLLLLACSAAAPKAVGTALVFATLIRIAALSDYARRQDVNWEAAGRMLLGGVPGVLTGSLLLAKVSAADLQALILLVGLTICTMAVYDLLRPWLASGSRMRDSKHLLGWLSFPVGLQVGFSGVGAGALGTLLLLNYTRLEASTVVGTVLVFSLGLSTLGSGVHAALGNCDFVLVGKLAIGGMLGVMLGGWMASRVPARPMRMALLALLAVLGGRLSWEGVLALLTLR